MASVRKMLKLGYGYCDFEISPERNSRVPVSRRKRTDFRRGK
jgi:hypothetical protein